MNDFYCEHPDHLGDNRRVLVKENQCVLTVDITTADTSERLGRIGPMLDKDLVGERHSGGVRICRVCALRWKKALLLGRSIVTSGDLQSLPEQGALL